MKKSRFIDEQIAFALRHASTRTLVDEVCRTIGISRTMIDAWTSKFSGLGVSEMHQLRQLEEENRWLKRLAGGLSLEKVVLQCVPKRIGSDASAAQQPR